MNSQSLAPLIQEQQHTQSPSTQSPSSEPKFLFPKVIDNSMLVTWRACRRKFFHSYCLNLKPRGRSIDLTAGSAFAKAVETYRKQIFHHASHEDAELESLRSFTQEWGEAETPPSSAKTFERMWLAFQRYIEEYPPLTDNLKPLIKDDGNPCVEFSFGIPLPHINPQTEEPLLFAGRFDMLATFDHDKVVIVDEKTTSRFDMNWASQWALRSQFMGYTWACQQLGYNVSQSIIRGICIQKSDIKFATGTALYGPYMIKRWEQLLHSSISSMVEACTQYLESGDSSAFEYNFGDACTSYGLCPFFDLCVSPDATKWYGNYDISIWNPLDHNPRNTHTSSHTSQSEGSST